MTQKRASSSRQVAILLSLYNGESYLDAQLSSILTQTHQDWTLYWRDDDSSDASRERMHAFAGGAGAGRCVEITSANGRLGVAGSYAHLLDAVPDTPYVAFADQDDIWEPQKLEWAVDMLSRHPADIPALYCARQYLTDEDLVVFQESSVLRRKPGFPASLTQNIATGHTVLLNAATHRLMQNNLPPPSVLHDWWAYLLTAAADGSVMFDDRCVSYYRQHAHNTVGASGSFIKRGWAALRRGPHVFMTIFHSNVTHLLAQPEHVSPSALRLLKEIAAARTFATRLRTLVMHRDLRRQRFSETTVFRIWYLFSR
ncbi:glycosyltransferase [Gluconobacter kanchanaburiensis]|uniref:Glycosyl transferase n=1 Tax=Gluconobacter kanchanaburiensis NBRC 103587 TaxID=1307948 RepID=A0A511B773_9PROT|nr:glycosyltransferase [Gluconobacter kanchanaburiensis]MBF0861942.1 glycosyltransferase [Gluconobacter kanchanaburiensis]GBR67758.1 glycosyltransferase [Gluconobacter kanchanaburiensis NBRC 103587]GEK95531.1 glycosyl transferase [Gluconobacter kanchanaburiensis NBRC 103587]